VTPEQIDAAIDGLQLAIINKAMVDGIVGHGVSEDCRDVKLGLTTEQSRPLLEAIIGVLQALKG
jgi:hypothetical protein